MRPPRRRLGVLRLTLVATLTVLAACGDDDAGGGTTSTGGGRTTAQGASPSTGASAVGPTTTGAPTAAPTVTNPSSVATPATAAAPGGSIPVTAPPSTGAPGPAPVGEPPCDEAALDAAAAPAEVHVWDDLLCLDGYAHAFVTFEDPAAASPEFVFVAGGDQWIVLVSGTQLDGDPALAGVPPEVLAAFQLVGPGGAGSDAQPPPEEGGSPEPTAPAVAAPCDAAALALAAGYEPDVALSDPVCVGEYARVQADVGDGITVDNVFAAGPSGWRVLASGFDLATDPAVLALPADVRAGLGF